MLYHSKSILKNLQYTSDNSAFRLLPAQLSFSSTHTYQEYQGDFGKGAAGCPCRVEVGVDGWSHIINVVLVSITSPVAPDAHIKHDHELSVLEQLLL